MKLQDVILKFASLEDVLKVMVEEGFEPGIYRRGKIWRAHANVGGKDWAEGKDPTRVLLEAATGAEPRHPRKTK